MKSDQEYIKGLLEAFEAAKHSTTDIYELKENGYDFTDERFIFHLKILRDLCLIEQEGGGTTLGYSRGAGGNTTWSPAPLRLTAQGHDFIAALRNKEIWNTIKNEFKDASIGTLCKTAKELSEAYVKSKIVNLLKGQQ